MVRFTHSEAGGGTIAGPVLARTGRWASRRAGRTLFAAALLAIGIQGQAFAGPARDVIASFHAALLETMQQAKSLGYSGRYEKLAPTIENTFDLAFMAQYSAGRHWRAFSAVQQKGLVDAFSRITIATYASRFNGYSGERFHILAENDARRGTKIVHTELEKSDGERIKLSYLMRQTKAGWRTIDVFVKSGISELATKRSDYGATLDRKGYEGLIAALEQMIAGLRDKG